MHPQAPALGRQGEVQEAGAGPATNQRSVFTLWTNQRSVFTVWTNQRSVFTVWTNQRSVLPELGQPESEVTAVVAPLKMHPADKLSLVNITVYTILITDNWMTDNR